MRGFTLIELLMTLGILVIIFVLAIPIAINFYQSYQLDSERNMLVSALKYTRSRAMTNRNESNHGLYIDTGNFIVFQGSSYASRIITEDKTFPRTDAVTITAPSEVVFTSLSGQNTASTTYALTNGQRTSYVYLNSEGRIEF